MLSTKLKEAAGNSADATLYVDDVFSTYLYTGNNVDGRLIQNDIDLLTKGGMVWIKARSSAQYHTVADTNRGMTNTPQLATNTNESASGYYISSYANNGFSVYGGAYGPGANATGITYASWTFRKAAKFFDVVTYTGDGTTNKVIPHSLGSVPGMIITKRTDSTGNWTVWHRAYSNDTKSYMYLNLTDALVYAPSATPITIDASSFTIGTNQIFGNGSGWSYVAYLFAHDTSSTGIIQCGSYNRTDGVKSVVNLGWEPQFIIYKTQSAASQWVMLDVMRSWTGASNSNLFCNLANAETQGNISIMPTATGFQDYTTAGATDTMIYMAIRMPNKPPTSGTQVYKPVAYTGNGSVSYPQTGVGFPPDFVFLKGRTVGWAPNWNDKLRGTTKVLNSASTSAEQTYNSVMSFDMNGFTLGDESSTNSNTYTYIAEVFKRAPGFFDVVCYTGVGAANVKYHNLNAIPELMIVKNRSNAYDWYVFATTANQQLVLNSSAASQGAINLLQSYSSTTFKWVDTSLVVNGNTMTYVAYLFATLAGISKVGSYTGNGTGQAIACGFSAGARFVLIKRTDSTGDWYTFDSARGLTSGSSPYLLLNSTAAEVTGNNGVYASTGGFTLGSTASTTTNINGASYIYLSVA